MFQLFASRRVLMAFSGLGEGVGTLDIVVLCFYGKICSKIFAFHLFPFPLQCRRLCHGRCLAGIRIASVFGLLLCVCMSSKSHFRDSRPRCAPACPFITCTLPRAALTRVLSLIQLSPASRSFRGFTQLAACSSVHEIASLLASLLSHGPALCTHLCAKACRCLGHTCARCVQWGGGWCCLGRHN